jgi:hypothetical protein
MVTAKMHSASEKPITTTPFGREFSSLVLKGQNRREGLQCDAA